MIFIFRNSKYLYHDRYIDEWSEPREGGREQSESQRQKEKKPFPVQADIIGGAQRVVR